MANLTPEDLEFIAMLEAKAKASKQEDFRRKARIARENRAAKNLARKKKNEFKLIENSLANHPQPINNQEIELNNDLKVEVKNESVNYQKLEDKDINQEVTIVNQPQSNNNQLESKAIDVETINQEVTIVNQSQSNINQLENKAIDVETINQEVTIVNQSQSNINQQSKADINQEIYRTIGNYWLKNILRINLLVESIKI